MERRSFLAGAGALGALALAGCTGGDDPGGGPSDPTGTPTGGMTFEPGPTEPHATATVGDRGAVVLPAENTAHEVLLWNDADATRSFRVAVTGAGETRLDVTWSVPDDGYVRLALAEPAAYRVTVTVAGTEAGHVDVGTGFFDCNDSTTEVQVTAAGDLRHRTVTTDMACAAPEIATSTFESGEGTCGTGHDATLSFDGATVSLDGRVQAPTPCHRAVLADASFDDARETLTLTVGVRDTDATVCVECVGEVPYEATLVFEDSPPDRVVVVHGEGADAREVATAAA